jgi:hypothetical protein
VLLPAARERAEPRASTMIHVAVDNSVKEGSRGIGSIIRCCVAFDVSTLIVVGRREYGTWGSQGSHKHIHVTHLDSWSQLPELAVQLGCTVLVISPSQLIRRPSERSGAIVGPASEGFVTSQSIETVEFATSTPAIFVVGPSEGLSDEHTRLGSCTIHVPFPLQSMERFVGYDAKLAVCLHHLTSGIERMAHTFDKAKEKYTIGEKKNIHANPEQVSESRRRAKLENTRLGEKLLDGEDGFCSLFDY